MSISRKPLRSVANSLADSFMSVMNYTRSGYAIEHVLGNAIKYRIDELSIDLLSGAAQPKKMLSPAVRDSVAHYFEYFPTLVRRSGSSIRFVRTASLTVKVDWRRARQTRWQPAAFSYRLTCKVSLMSDLGRSYVGTREIIWPGPKPRPRLLNVLRL